MKLTIEQVIETYKRIAMEKFGWEMNLPVYEFNMRSSWGNYHWKWNRMSKKPVPDHFKIASRLINGDYEEEYIIHNISHELIHYYTDVTEGKPCHHNAKWKANCRKFGIKDNRLSNYPKIGSKPTSDEQIYLNATGSKKTEGKKRAPLPKGQYYEVYCKTCGRVKECQRTEHLSKISRKE